jgi:predicted RND superfamily exporter protein
VADRIARALATLALRHSRAVLWTAAVLTAFALAGASVLRFDPDILNLVPQKDREVNEFKKVLGDLGSIDYHVAVVRVPAGRDAADYQAYVDALAERLSKSERIANATWRLPDPLQYLDALLPNALLFLDPPELELVAAKLSDARIRESVARNRALLQTPQASAIEPLVRYDPFDLLPIYLRRFQRAGGGFRLDTASGYYLSEDQTTYLILMKPVRPAQDVPFGRELLLESASIVRETLADFRKSAPTDLPPPRVDFTGGYAIATGDADLIQKDVISNVLFSFFGVLALFVYGFRRTAAIGYAAIPMGVALALTFGIAGVAFGVLSSASAGFAALLAGLGIDFNTVLYGRYVDERNRGLSMEDALTTTLVTTLPSVTMAASTTAITFFTFLLTDFRGMTEMGLLTGMGILLFLCSVVFLLPSLIVANEGGPRARRKPTLYHHSFGSEKLIAVSTRHPKTVIWLWIGFVAIALVAATRLSFSDNIQNLRASGNRGVEVQDELTQKFGQSFNSMMLVFYGTDPEDVLARTSRVLPELDALVAKNAIGSYQSVGTFIPPAERQRRAIEYIRANPGAFDADRIEGSFRSALTAEGFRPEIYDQYLASFRRALQPERPLTVDELIGRDVSNISSRFLHQNGARWMSVVYLYPEDGTWPREVPPELGAFAKRHPDAILTGVNLVSGALRRIVRADAFRATFLGTVAVLVLMFVGFLRVGATVLSFVPFLAGAAGMAGLMAILRLEFNFMNVFVGLMIVGVATDYAIYMLKRWHEDPAMFVDGGAAETAKSISMAAVTTVVGYGSFAFSHYPGLRSIGYASTFGIGLSAIATMSLLPAILLLLGRRRGLDSAPPG